MLVSRADAEHRAALSLAFPTESPGVPTRGQPSQERWCPLRHGWLPTKLSLILTRDRSEAPEVLLESCKMPFVALIDAGQDESPPAEMSHPVAASAARPRLPGILMYESQLSPRFRCPDPTTRCASAAGTRAARARTELPKMPWVLRCFGCDGSDPLARRGHSRVVRGQRVGRVPPQCPAALQQSPPTCVGCSSRRCSPARWAVPMAEHRCRSSHWWLTVCCFPSLQAVRHHARRSPAGPAVLLSPPAPHRDSSWRARGRVEQTWGWWGAQPCSWLPSPPGCWKKLSSLTSTAAPAAGRCSGKGLILDASSHSFRTFSSPRGASSVSTS